jgi:hypothetical protein
MYRSSSISLPTIVAVLLIEASTPESRMRLPAGARSTSIVYLSVSYIAVVTKSQWTDLDSSIKTSSTIAGTMSSSSSSE